MNAGDRVKFLKVFDLAPYEVYDRVGEVGTAMERTVTKKGDRVWSVWLVVFDDGLRLWIKQRDLEVVE
jgi:hypothetical protein